MVLPLYDTNPLRSIRVPGVTYGLIAANILVYAIFQSGFVFNADIATTAALGMIPAALRGTAVISTGFWALPEPFPVVTYMFVHGGWIHLFGNMLFLWVFGDNVEDDLGHARFLLFYLLCGAAAALAYALSAPDSNDPLIGASGAIAGVLAAYVILHPRVKVWVLVAMRVPLRIRARWVIGAWFLLQVVNILLGSDDGTAWWAHVGGFAAGAALVPFMRRPGVPLFDQEVA
jgi:membrane associated rhomboid family serine protease